MVGRSDQPAGERTVAAVAALEAVPSDPDPGWRRLGALPRGARIVFGRRGDIGCFRGPARRVGTNLAPCDAGRRYRAPGVWVINDLDNSLVRIPAWLQASSQNTPPENRESGPPPSPQQGNPPQDQKSQERK